MKKKKTPKTNKHAKWSSAKHFLSDSVLKTIEHFGYHNGHVIFKHKQRLIFGSELLGGLIHRDISS